jgi:hypothetical protein
MLLAEQFYLGLAEKVGGLLMGCPESSIARFPFTKCAARQSEKT